MDGNCKADHMIMKKPEDDICLADGDGYWASSKEYQHHLECSTYGKEVGPPSPWENLLN